MAAMKKGTKLTETPKDFMLRVRLDNETLVKLDKVAEVNRQTRSEVVRIGIDKQYSELMQ